MTTEQRYPFVPVGFIDQNDIELVKELTLEYYQQLFPKLEYLELSDSESIVHPLYGTSKRSDRAYTSHRLILAPIPEPENMGMTAFGIDVTRNAVFHAPIAAFEQLGLVPKEGDVVVYDGDRYEVSVARRWLESKIGHTDAYSEYELITSKPRSDFSQDGS